MASASAAAGSEKGDHLCLASNPAVQKMLQKEGHNSPLPEVVVFSDFVTKINRKEKEQTRVLLLTDKAIYNLLPSAYGKCKRRISLESVTSVTASSISDEFVLHVPEEYDYRFKSPKKDQICELVPKLFKALWEKEEKAALAAAGPGGKIKKKRIHTTYVNDEDLKEHATTKAQARLQTREEILRRKQQAQEIGEDSDQEEQKKAVAAKAASAGSNGASSAASASASAASNGSTATDDGMENMLEGTEKVKLEDFELLKVLGRGSFGKVMQVRFKATGTVYAMKILKKRAIIARNQVEHTRAERKILQSLQHPFLMTLRYAFQSKEKLYFVLDYFQGGELFFHLKNNRRFSEEVARIYVGEIALALGHLHSLSIIYRDLKPENILLDDQGHVCLTDFGLSKDVDPSDKAHTFCGTPEYLAPEIVTGQGHDKAVDWWSLGILLYELTVGIPPFYSQNVNEMYNKIQHGVLRFPPFLSEHCKSLIVGLLNRDPRKRLGSTQDVEDIKAHPFFSAISFDAMMAKKIDVPYKPRVKGADDSSNFDATFTSEPVVDSMVQGSELSKTLNEGGNAFGDFTFQQKGMLG